MSRRKTAGAGAVAAALAALMGVTLLSGPDPALIEGQEHAPGGDTIQAVPFPGTPEETAATQKLVFRYRNQDSLNFPRTRVSADMSAHRSPAGFVLYASPDSTSPPLTLGVALDRLERRTQRVNARWFIRAEGDGFKRSVVRIDRNPTTYLATVGNEAIDVLVGTVVTNFPEVRSYGIQVCKKISRSSTWSQHSYGNAVDFGGAVWGAPASIQMLDQIDAFVRRLTEQGWLKVSQFGWRNWPHHYPGHSHYSGAPLRTGTPECAR